MGYIKSVLPMKNYRLIMEMEGGRAFVDNMIAEMLS